MGEMISAGNWLSFSFSMISAAYTRELFEGGIEECPPIPFIVRRKVRKPFSPTPTNANGSCMDSIAEPGAAMMPPSS